MRFLQQCALTLLVTAAAPALAFDPFVVKDIRVEGIQRTDAGTVFSYLPVKVGETLTQARAAEAIRALYATGFFQDVSLEVDNGVLIVAVTERPSIAQLDFIGVKEFPKEALEKAMREIGLVDGRIFDRSLLDRAEQELKRQYVSRGKYAAVVTTTVTPLERNRVGITFDVVEGDTAKIRQITIIGNKAFPEKELVSRLSLSTPGWITWYTKADQYSRQKLTADLETLRSYYQDRGYAEFQIESTQVSITPDKKDVYITIGVNEGPKYTISDIKVGGDTLIPEGELQKLVLVRDGEVFSRAKITQTSKRITDRLGNEGYAFANVNVVPEIDKEKQTVALTFLVDPGRRVYVRRVNITGNTKTRDEVIRREMRQMEGAWFSQEKVQQSKFRLDKTSYFNEVAVETPAVTGTTDQVDVNINVTEKPTGNLLLGAGFGSTEGLILSGSITQQNIFGSGNHMGISVNTSRLNTVYSLSFTNPYFTVDGISRGFDIFYRNTNPNSVNLGNYTLETYGASLRFGVPLSETNAITYGIGYESTNIGTDIYSPINVLNYVNTFGSHTTALLLSAGWNKDGRDSVLYPTRGGIQRAFGEVSLPGGNLRFYKLSYEHTQYFPLTQDLTLALRGEIGYGDGYNNLPLPFFRNFYTGGPTSIRGFYPASVGPVNIDGNPIGGSKKIIGSGELLFPIPGLTQDKAWRFSVFTDTGFVDDSYDFGKLRVSAGFGVSWISPFGPLKVSMAQPILKEVTDRKQVFQFQFGGMF
ncbi:MAG: outer membrane protein assembly factor BamA [Burkholderiales bacterium]